MTSAYPGALDTFTNPGPTDPQTSPSHAGQHADANDAIEAIQATLGIDPHGSEADVAARLLAIEAALGGGAGASIAPGSIANSGGSASVTDGVVSFTGVTSISINGMFDTAVADDYLVIFNAVLSANDYIHALLRAAGADNTSSNYYYGVRRVAYSGSAADYNGSGVAFWRPGAGDTGVPCRWAMNVFSPALAEHTAFAITASDVGSGGAGGGRFNGATVFDGVTFKGGTGGTTLTGKLRVYPYQKTA